MRYGRIPLTQGLWARVDMADYPALARFKWCAVRRGDRWYAQRRQGDKILWMHRVILRAPPGLTVDHVDGNGLDNRRCNLRLATNAQQQWNRRKQPRTTSRYKGVWWSPSRAGDRPWQSQIKVNGRHISLGRFRTQREAHLAYREAATRYFGRFARFR